MTSLSWGPLLLYKSSAHLLFPTLSPMIKLLSEPCPSTVLWDKWSRRPCPGVPLVVIGYWHPSSPNYWFSEVRKPLSQLRTPCSPSIGITPLLRRVGFYSPKTLSKTPVASLSSWWPTPWCPLALRLWGEGTLSSLESITRFLKIDYLFSLFRLQKSADISFSSN